VPGLNPGGYEVKTWFQSLLSNGAACTAYAKGIRVWDVRTNMVVTTLDTDSPVTSIEITGNGRYITTADGGAGGASCNPVDIHSLKAPGFNPCT
jgi:WD40 repeat protein